MDNLYIIKDRLNEAMALRNVNITELASMSGLNKSTVSRYLTGAVIPRSVAIGKMANALGVSPSWVLGYNVTMDGKELTENIPDNKVINEINVLYERLSPNGQEELKKFAEYLIAREENK